MLRKMVADKMRRLALVFLLCVPGLIVSTDANVPAKDRITPVYDLYIGFLGRGECEPLNVQFRQLSIETVFRNLKFKFTPVTYRKKTFDWTLDSADSPSLLMPIPGVGGTGEITDHDLCPFWNLSSDKPHRPLKATLVHVAPKIWPLFSAVDRKNISRIKDKILAVIPEDFEDEDRVPLVPLVPLHPCVFEFTSNIEPGQTKITLENSDAVYRIDDIKFYASLPVDELLAGKDVSLEYRYRHPLVNKPGILTVRFIPAKK